MVDAMGSSIDEVMEMSLLNFLMYSQTLNTPPVAESMTNSKKGKCYAIGSVEDLENILQGL